MDAVELAYAGISRQAQLIASGEVSSRELVELYLERIERLDGKLNCFRVVFGERARVEADQADGRRGAGDRRPLGGVPIAVKDDIDVAGEVTAFGTNAHGGPEQSDAELVSRLRAAGAVVIGKANVPELSSWPFTESATLGVARAEAECVDALEGAGDVLRSLRHEGEDLDAVYGMAATAAVARYLRGIHVDARALAHPERLEPRPRRMARLSAMVSPALLERA